MPSAFEHEARSGKQVASVLLSHFPASGSDAGPYPSASRPRRALAYGVFAGNTGSPVFASGLVDGAVSAATAGAAGGEVSFAIRAELATCPDRGASEAAAATVGAAAARICVAGAAAGVRSGGASVVRTGKDWGAAAAPCVGVP